MKQGDIVWGTYSPQRTDDLTNKMRDMVGKRIMFRVGNKIDYGRFRGQHVLISLEMTWVPECDVQIETKEQA